MCGRERDGEGEGGRESECCDFAAMMTFPCAGTAAWDEFPSALQPSTSKTGGLL